LVYTNDPEVVQEVLQKMLQGEGGSTGPGMPLYRGSVGWASQ
jgi:hypothetical protein